MLTSRIFIRTRVMAHHGGQYFDDGSWVIRDLAPFRKAGFENVFGKQKGVMIFVRQCGCLLQTML